MMDATDITVYAHGGLCFVQGETGRGSAWLARNIPDAMEFGGARVVEPRYLDDIVRGAEDAGLMVDD